MPALKKSSSVHNAIIVFILAAFAMISWQLYSQKSPPQTADARVVLTPEKYPHMFPSPQVCEQDFHFNADPPDAIIPFSNSLKGIGFDVPFNAKWGNEQYRLNPYDETADTIEFGRIQDLGACSWLRSYRMKVLPARSAEEALESILNNPSTGEITLQPTIVTVGDFTTVRYVVEGKCNHPLVELVGKKYNYEFMVGCGMRDQQQADFELLMKVVESAKFIE